jgi:hypothetical protein
VQSDEVRLQAGLLPNNVSPSFNVGQQRTAKDAMFEFQL